MRVAVFWSGGKDSFAAYEKALAGGHRVECLATFSGGRPFLCHPERCMGLQAKALGLPHAMIGIREPYLQSHRDAIGGLVGDFGIEGVVTGDIAPLDAFHSNWVEEACRGTGVAVLKPLWGTDRLGHLRSLLASRARIAVTCAMKNFFGPGWVGRGLDARAVSELEALSKECGIDPCGEGGEYHTMVLGSPCYGGEIGMEWQSIGETETLWYAKGASFRLRGRE